MVASTIHAWSMGIKPFLRVFRIMLRLCDSQAVCSISFGVKGKKGEHGGDRLTYAQSERCPRLPFAGRGIQRARRCYQGSYRHDSGRRARAQAVKTQLERCPLHRIVTVWCAFPLRDRWAGFFCAHFGQTSTLNSRSEISRRFEWSRRPPDGAAYHIGQLDEIVPTGTRGLNALQQAVPVVVFCMALEIRGSPKDSCRSRPRAWGRRQAWILLRRSSRSGPEAHRGP